MAHQAMFDEFDEHLVRLRRLIEQFPGAEEYVSHGRPNFRVKKNFAIYGGSIRRGPRDHLQVPHALQVKIDPVELAAIDADDRFFFPAYVGAYGWRGVDLSAGVIDDVEVVELLDASYRQVAGAKWVAQLDAR